LPFILGRAPELPPPIVGYSFLLFGSCGQKNAETSLLGGSCAHFHTEVARCIITGFRLQGAADHPLSCHALLLLHPPPYPPPRHEGNFVPLEFRAGTRGYTSSDTGLRRLVSQTFSRIGVVYTGPPGSAWSPPLKTARRSGSLRLFGRSCPSQ